MCKSSASVSEQTLLLYELKRNAESAKYTLEAPEASHAGTKRSYLVEILKDQSAEKGKFKKPGKKCEVCGEKAKKACGRCKSTYYCSKEHQKEHWREGGHKTICQNAEGAWEAEFGGASGSVVFPVVQPGKPPLEKGVATLSEEAGEYCVAQDPSKRLINVHREKKSLSTYRPGRSCRRRRCAVESRC